VIGDFEGTLLELSGLSSTKIGKELLRTCGEVEIDVFITGPQGGNVEDPKRGLFICIHGVRSIYQ
jgi:hypothetical protein